MTPQFLAALVLLHLPNSLRCFALAGGVGGELDFAEPKLWSTEREARFFFNTTTLTNTTQAALVSGAILFLGLNTAFALAVLDGGGGGKAEDYSHGPTAYGGFDYGEGQDYYSDPETATAADASHYHHHQRSFTRHRR